MLNKPVSVVLFFIIALFLWESVMARSGKIRVFNREDPKGQLHDVCLDDRHPVTIKKMDTNLYFVRVRNRYSGPIKAGSFGEARNIACKIKTDLNLYKGGSRLAPPD